MYVKTGIMAFTSAAVIFLSADILTVKHQVQDIGFLSLPSVTAAQEPLSTGHYLVASIPTLGTMTDALPAALQENVRIEEFRAALAPPVSAPEKKTHVLIDTDSSAAAMIKQPVYDRQGQRIGTIHDIIVDRTGGMMKTVIADGSAMSIGDKKAVFSSDLITYDPDNERYVMNITEDDIAKAKAFSYDPTKASASVETVPPEGLSVKRLMAAAVVDQNDDVLAEIDNISFDFNRNIDKVIIVFDRVLGMGGEKAAVDFSKLRLVEDRKGTRFQLTDNQTAEFRAFKK